MNYSFSFSLTGFLIVLLPMIPNFFYFLLPNAFSTEKIENKHLILDIIEHGSQFFYIALLIFITTNKNLSMQSLYFVGMVVSLVFYYILWILLFSGHKNLIILISMAIFPVIYFILSEIWINNLLSTIPTVIFGVVHVIITYKDFTSSNLN
ncbi:hypothetical protein ACQPU1_07995 [Clostridium paraputrificum]